MNVQVLKKTADAVHANHELADDPGQILALVLLRLADRDLDGAHATLRDWCNNLAWRKAGTDGIVSIADALIDKIAELTAEPVRVETRRSLRDFSAQQDEYSFTSSSHLSLLTASVMRQRSQITELLGLVDKLSRRFA